MLSELLKGQWCTDCNQGGRKFTAEFHASDTIYQQQYPVRICTANVLVWWHNRCCIDWFWLLLFVDVGKKRSAVSRVRRMIHGGSLLKKKITENKSKHWVAMCRLGPGGPRKVLDNQIEGDEEPVGGKTASGSQTPPVQICSDVSTCVREEWQHSRCHTALQTLTCPSWISQPRPTWVASETVIRSGPVYLRSPTPCPRPPHHNLFTVPNWPAWWSIVAKLKHATIRNR